MDNKFIVDFMLGRLCRWLRLLGLDTEYYRGGDKGAIIYRSLKDRRVILTRDASLSKKKALRLYLVSSDDFRQQLKEVICEFELDPDEKCIFTRCLECNSVLESIDKDKIKSKVPEYVYDNHDAFSVCGKCRKVYWKGTHRKLIRKVLKEIGGCRISQ